MSTPLPDDYAVLLATVKERIRGAQYEALRAVNKRDTRDFCRACFGNTKLQPLVAETR